MKKSCERCKHYLDCSKAIEENKDCCMMNCHACHYEVICSKCYKFSEFEPKEKERNEV